MMVHLTQQQKWIQKYVDTQFYQGAVGTYPVGKDMLVVVDRVNDRLVLASDQCGNIYDAERRQLLALSNASPTDIIINPTAWTPITVVIRDK